MLTITDCFAYTVKAGKPGCSALNDNAACCEGCTLYKTVEENNRQAQAAKERLALLGTNKVKRKRKGAKVWNS